jgi:hypothetical protein
MKAQLLLGLLMNPCGMLALGVVLYAAGDWASAGRERLRRFGSAVAGLALIASVAYGIHRRMSLGTLALGSAGFGLGVLGTGWIVLSFLSFVVDALTPAPAAPPEPEPQPPPPPPPQPPPPPLPPPPPPPPTEEERIAAARERYEARLRRNQTLGLDEIELKAANQDARKKYLKEIDGSTE